MFSPQLVYTGDQKEFQFHKKFVMLLLLQLDLGYCNSNHRNKPNNPNTN